MGVFAKSKTKKEENKVEETPVLNEGKKSIGKTVMLVKQVLITEKSSAMSGYGKYVFIVDKSANKPEIKKAIESIYSVNVVSVNVINSKGKAKRLGRTMGKTSGHKKAIISLKEGQKIDVIPV